MTLLRRIFGKKAQPTTTEQIAFMLDKNADLGARDDVAMALGSSDDPAAEGALIQITLDHNEDEALIASAVDSLQEIWARHGKFETLLVQQMHPAAKKYFMAGT